MPKIEFYDTTLRDGKQAEGVQFSLADMIAIAKRLDEFGVDYIECGWPAALPKDKEFFQEIRKVELKKTKVCAFGSTRHAKNKPSEDVNLIELVKSEAPVITIFGKSWDLHVKEAFKIKLEANLDMITDSIAYLKDADREVFFDAEHFFDGFNENPEYAIRSLKAAEKGGADRLVLCDTNGGMLPSQITTIVKTVLSEVKVPIGLHVHNDSGCGVANSIAGIQAGGIQVQGTINGIGERCGNADLTSIIPGLLLKLGYENEFVDSQQLEELTSLSRFVYEIANLVPDNKQPYTGLSAFAHKAGVHVNAVKKNPRTYEHEKPETVGNRRRILISEQAGKSNIIHKIEELGLHVDEQTLPELSKEIKELENTGYEFEGADASFELLVKRLSGQFKEYFEVDSFKTLNYFREGMSPVIEATVKAMVGNETELTVSEGDGPVNALDNALKNAVCVFYPEVEKIRLEDFKVRILNPKAGTAALTRVLIRFRYPGMEWSTVGVSGDIIEASWEALVDGMNYILMKLDEK